MRKLKNSELGRKSVNEYKKAAKSPIIIVLDNVRSMNNIGSVFRTADAFLVKAVHLCGITAKPPHKDIQKTALGATESVPWKYYETTIETIQQLKDDGYIIISVEQAEEAILLGDFVIKKGGKYAVIFGHEVRGVAQEIIDLSDYCIEIPQFGTKH
ncbi:MAG: TrmH family RNA methyltransferase, partial [Bacteroidales bacterium]|nr:TrmH family RNA methyltransferase [Bacteroidales bacterium]